MSDSVELTEDGPQLLQAQRPKKLAETVAAQLLNYITSQNLEPGTPLAPQSWMLENLDVGRASLREALRFLEMHGFIELRSGRNGGPLVGDPSAKNFARMSSMYFHALGVTVGEVLDARSVLEPAMVRLVAEKGLDDDSAARLRPFGSAGCVGRVAPTGSSRPWDHDLHASVAELADNAVLKLVAQGMRDIYGGVAREVLPTPEDATRIEEMHTRITDAILSGNGPEAERLMSEHNLDILKTYQERYPHLLAERISWP